MADNTIAPPPKQTELQRTVERLGIVQNHLSNLIVIAHGRSRSASEELHSILAAARRFVEDEFDILLELDKIAIDAAKKGASK